MFDTATPDGEGTIADLVASYLPSYRSIVQGGGKG